MRIFMVILDIFCAIMWGAIAIAAWCGMEIHPVTIGCACLMAAVTDIEDAIRHWRSV